MTIEIPCATCGPDRTFDDPADCPTCAGTRLDYVETPTPRSHLCTTRTYDVGIVAWCATCGPIGLPQASFADAITIADRHLAWSLA